MDYDRPQEFLPAALRGKAFHEPKRPQERSWRDRAEPALAGLSVLWDAWLREHPEGGAIPLDDWAEALRCSREALARAVAKLAQGTFSLERKLVAKPLDGA
jgi:putative ATPase